MSTHYKHLAIADFVGKPTQPELQAIEQELGTKLPTDFIEFLNTANGGCTEYSVNVPPPDGEPISLYQLYSTKNLSVN
jgi:hypothetical protein